MNRVATRWKCGAKPSQGRAQKRWESPGQRTEPRCMGDEWYYIATETKRTEEQRTEQRRRRAAMRSSASEKNRFDMQRKRNARLRNAWEKQHNERLWTDKLRKCI